MAMKILEDPKRAAIIDAIAMEELRFNQLAKKLGMRSNELAYHLNILAGEGCIEKKESEQYALTDKGKVLVPYIKFIQRDEIPPTVFCAPVVVRDNKVLFIRRDKEPFKGFLEFPGGKIMKGETLIQAAIRELREETNVIAENGRLTCIADLLTSNNHHFIGIYIQLEFVKDLGEEGASHDEVIWIAKNDINDAEQMLDDNKLIISEFLDKELRHITLFYDEEHNKARLID